MGDLSDIKHVVILTQENRSFDEYFGTFPGATGFSDPTAGGIFNQPGFSVSPNGLTPYRMSTFTASGIYGLAVNKGFGPGATGQPLVFASVNDGVFLSRDLGDTWVNCSLGLPSCPQGADIQCVDITKVTAYGFEFGGSALYLATWGRSVWRATLNDAEEGGPPIPHKPIMERDRAGGSL